MTFSNTSLNKIFNQKRAPIQYPDVPSKLPFEIEGDENDCRRIIALINRIAENSPSGTAVLNEAAQHCKLVLSSEQTSVGYATCGDEKNPDWRIALNPRYPDDILASTLVHESRHICQFANGCKEYPRNTLNMKSAIMLDRAMEADADTAACMTVMELAKAGDMKALLGFARIRPSVVKAACETLKENPKASVETLQKSAFRGWYDSEGIKKGYEKAYYTRPMKLCMLFRMTQHWKGGSELTSDQVVQKVGIGGYFKTPADLESGKYADLHAKTVKTLDKFFAVREMRDGTKPDESYKNCPVRYPWYQRGINFENTAQAKKTVPNALALKTSLSKGR